MLHLLLSTVPAVGVYYPSNPRMSGNLPYLIIAFVVFVFLIGILAGAVAHWRKKRREERIEAFHRRKRREEREERE